MALTWRARVSPPFDTHAQTLDDADYCGDRIARNERSMVKLKISGNHNPSQLVEHLGRNTFLRKLTLSIQFYGTSLVEQFARAIATSRISFLELWGCHISAFATIILLGINEATSPVQCLSIKESHLGYDDVTTFPVLPPITREDGVSLKLDFRCINDDFTHLDELQLHYLANMLRASNISSLSLHSFGFLDVELLYTHGIQHSPMLSSLDITVDHCLDWEVYESGYGDNVIIPFANALMDCQVLQSLQLPLQFATNEGFVAISHLVLNSSVSSVEFQLYTDADQVDVEILVEAIQQSGTKVKHVAWLEGNLDNVFRPISWSSNKADSFKMRRHCNAPRKVLPASVLDQMDPVDRYLSLVLENGVQTAVNLRELCLNGVTMYYGRMEDIARTVNNNNNIEVLELSQCCITDSDLDVFLANWPPDSTIISLNFFMNQITTVGAQRLLEASILHENLTTISLRRNPLYNAGLFNVANLLPSLRLTSLDIALCRGSLDDSSSIQFNVGIALKEKIAINYYMRQFDVSGNNLAFSDVVHLEKCIFRNSAHDWQITEFHNLVYGTETTPVIHSSLWCMLLTSDAGVNPDSIYHFLRTMPWLAKSNESNEPTSRKRKALP